jgi:hypothetical protein
MPAVLTHRPQQAARSNIHPFLRQLLPVAAQIALGDVVGKDKDDIRLGNLLRG